MMMIIMNLIYIAIFLTSALQIKTTRESIKTTQESQNTKDEIKKCKLARVK